MNDSFATSGVVVIFILVVFLLVVIDLLVSGKNGNRSYKYRESISSSNDNMKDLNGRNKEKLQRIEKRHRAFYWDYIGKIYDRQSTDTLIRVKDILRTMQDCYFTDPSVNPVIEPNDINTHNIDIWYSNLGELRNLLSQPTWRTDTIDSQSYRMPLFYDLDIKYIEDLLEEREK